MRTKIQDVLGFIDYKLSNFEKVNVKLILKEFNLTKRELNTLFKKELHHSPQIYLEKRLLQAITTFIDKEIELSHKLITEDKIAEKFKISWRWLYTLFVKILKIKPHEYIELRQFTLSLEYKCGKKDDLNILPYGLMGVSRSTYYRRLEKTHKNISKLA